MAKQLNVNLAFTADTGKAKAQLKDLQNQLTQVMTLSSKNFGLSSTINIEAMPPILYQSFLQSF